MEQKPNQSRIKLPSSALVVSADSIWKFIETINRTGNVFTKDALKRNGLYTKTDDVIKRNLSYLKYLGIIEESREKINVGDKKESVQKFKIIEEPLVSDLFYELRASITNSERINLAKEKWKSVLKNHELFKTFRTNFFKDNSTKTLFDLEQFLRQENPNKSPLYYQNGGKFIVELFYIANLVTKKDNYIILTDYEARANSSENEKITQDEIQKPVQEEEKEDIIDEINCANDFYTIVIKGPEINTSIKIKDNSTFAILDAILNKIRDDLKIINNESD